MTYEQALEKIASYRSIGSTYGLEGITRLMEALGRPERDMQVIHVAGTNGKGSTVTTLAMILTACGYHTATYTSPEVTTYLDRFRIDQVPASQAAFTAAFETCEAACQEVVAQGHPHPSVFEMELAIAYLIARNHRVPIMVQETGLGGRLDATNVVEHPRLVVFTAIGMDHMQLLGDTIEAIAREKAGIIKEGCPVVAYDNGLAVDAIIKEAALAKGVPVSFSSAEMMQVLSKDLDGETVEVGGLTYHYPLVGVHQLHNLALILKCVEALRKQGYDLPPHKVQQALEKVRWPGRFEVVSRDPVIILDGAHNPQAAQALAQTLTQWFPGKKAHFLLHIFKDKDALGIMEALAPVCARLEITTIDTARSASVTVLSRLAQGVMPDVPIYVNDDFDSALDEALAALPQDGMLLICGSLSHLETARRALGRSLRLQ
jgi:dihydrofolate synthase/folylpolyglutamate synthase